MNWGVSAAVCRSPSGRMAFIPEHSPVASSLGGQPGSEAYSTPGSGLPSVGCEIASYKVPLELFCLQGSLWFSSDLDG